MKELKLGILLLVFLGAFFMNLYQPEAGTALAWVVLIVLWFIFNRLTGEDLLKPVDGPIRSLDLTEREFAAEQARHEAATDLVPPERRMVSGWPRKLAYLAGAFFALGVAAFGTIPKIRTMYMITGRIEGAVAETRVITSKWEERGRDGLYYVLSWGEGTHAKDSRYFTNVDGDVWRSTHVGDKLELVRVPGDDHAYLAHDDIFVADGFALDYTLLAAELLFGCWALLMSTISPTHLRRAVPSTVNA